ncbi:MAG TPA: septal ring lytic transglycosylase RlpA family protein [Polyangiaceae bacterium]|nr:septal ring lytic transglycosylase RlpA family protein [Polyangiaceae bacterium]
MRRAPRVLAALAIACTSATSGACARTEALPPAREPAREAVANSRSAPPRAEVQVGYATWYGAALAGHRTANGERFDPEQMTAAHRTLPFNTWVEVRRVETGQSVRVRITDRGPFGHPERIIDLSRAAARELGIMKLGTARVEIRVVAAAEP